MQIENGLPASGVERLAPEAAAARERMEIALALARRAARPVALLAVAIEDGAPAELVGRVGEAVRSLLRAAIGPDGPPLLAARGLDFALLAGRGLDEAQVQAQRLIEEAKHLLLPGLERELRVGLSIGLARDEREKDYWLEALFAVAAEGVEIARSLGGEAVAHTELYALCQRKAERAGPRPTVVIPPELEARALAGIPAAMRSPGAPPRVVPQVKRPAPAPAAPHIDGRLAAAPVAPLQPVPAGDGEADAAPADADAQHAIDAREREHREEVERLERRIAKLMETLDSTERELRELARRQSEPLGVSSFYRDVQGLSAGDSHYEVKAALMERILQANLELREILRGRGETQR